MEQSRQQTGAAAGAAGAAPQSTDCAHLHSAFGPGCPYCWTPAPAAAGPRGGRPASASLGEQAELPLSLAAALGRMLTGGRWRCG